MASLLIGFSPRRDGSQSLSLEFRRMPRRQAEVPGWSGIDRFDDPVVTVGIARRHFSLWVGEILLVAIVIAGVVMVSSAIFSGPAAAPSELALKGHTQVIEAVAFSPDGRHPGFVWLGQLGTPLGCEGLDERLGSRRPGHPAP